MLLYEFLTGHLPFTGSFANQMYHTVNTSPPPFHEINPEVQVPAGIETLVLRCLAKLPKDRPQTARELWEEFERALPKKGVHWIAIVIALLFSLVLLVWQVIVPTKDKGEAPKIKAPQGSTVQSKSGGKVTTVIPPKSEAPPAQTVPSSIITRSTGTKLVRIEPGKSLMGSEVYSEERPIHHVTISQPFYFGVCEISQREYTRLMGNNPGHFKSSDSLPVEQVSRFEAVEFCNILSQKEGLTPYYRIEGTGDNRSVAITDRNGTGYRLPTEAEWEFACQADPTSPDALAWYKDNSNSKTHPVGKKDPNAFGLHDMRGNVWEWCWDLYDKDYYQQMKREDPTGPGIAGSDGPVRILRGGAWGEDKELLRSAKRFKRKPAYRGWSIGFRIARTARE